MSWFTDQALEQCRKTVAVYNEAMPISGKALAQGVEWLEQAKRLRLDMPLIPFETEERKIARLGEYGYGLDAPWPVTAIEYEHGGTYDVAQDYTRALSTKRIALCVAVSDAMAPGLSDSLSDEVSSPTEPRVPGAPGIPGTHSGVISVNDLASGWGSFVIWPISYFDEKKEWEFSPGAVIVPRFQGHQQMALAANQFLALANKAETALLAKLKRLSPEELDEHKPMVVRYQPMMPELCKKLGNEHANKMIRESSLDALWVILGAYMAMACDNVVIERDSRALYVDLPRSGRHSLDPFRGSRRLSWTGRGVWQQQTRTPEVQPKDA